MKINHFLSLSSFAIISLFLFACSGSKNSPQSEEVKLITKADSASYIIGVQMADNFKRQKYADQLNHEAMLAGMKAQFESDSMLFDLQMGNKIVGEFIQSASKAGSADKIAEGEAFLRENAKRPEVHVTESGLQYEILVEGKGEVPNANSTVKAHYHGMLLDGTVFDSSVERGQPFKTKVGQVIKGWVEALQMMPVGSKWKLYIPYDLAYGERGAGGVIGPYETLIFEIELLEIVK